MGAQPSSIAELDRNPWLVELTGDKKLEREDKFWDELLGFSFTSPSKRSDSRILEAAASSLCKKMATNNHVTGNFTTLACIFVCRAQNLLIHKEKTENPLECQLTHNSLLLTRCFCNYFVNNLPEQEVIRQFNTLPACSGTRTIFEEFLLHLNRVIGELQARPSLYFLHLEAVNTLLSLLAVQMSEMKPTLSSTIYLSLMNSKCSEESVQVIRRLFHNYIKNDVPPADDNSSGFLSRTFSGIWSLFGASSAETEDGHLHPLANQSVLLLLVFVYHMMKQRNPYRDAVYECKALRTRKVDDVPPRNGMRPCFNLNFSRLSLAITRDLQKDQTVLLLYTMLHRNESFLQHVLQREDLESLVLPILHILYEPDEINSHVTYMALIVLLILSQEEIFNKKIHKLVLPNVTWFKERTLQNITLGGVLILVVVRMIHHNMIKMRDKYLHTNCLATLANMSCYFHELNSYVCDRLVSLFEQLLKRHAKLVKTARLGHTSNGAEEFSDLTVLEEIIRMVLEIVNSCLTNTLQHNPNLVYTMLYRQELFVQFRAHPKFQDIIQNIDTVLTYFSSKLENHPSQTLSVEDVLDTIRKELRDWPQDRLLKFPELKFRYMEEDQPEEFFVPYVWSLVFKSSNLYWNSDKIALFQVVMPKDTS